MSYAVSRAQRPDTDAAFVSRAATGSAVPRFTVTTERLGNILLKGDSDNYTTAPPVTRLVFPVSGVSSNRISVSGTSGADSRVTGYFDGCPARFYRVVDGALDLVREDTVSAWHSREYVTAWNIGKKYLPAGNTTWRWARDSWSRPSAPVWFAVSTVAANGTYSAPSAWATFTTPAAYIAPVHSNPSLGDLTLTTVSGALTAPTGVTVTVENGGGTAAVSWNAVPDAHGYVVWRTQYDPAGGFLTDCLDLVGGAGKAAVQTGDMMIVERVITDGATRANQCTDRTWGAFGYAKAPSFFGLDDENAGQETTHVADPAEGTVTRLTLASGQTRTVTFYCHGGTGQDYYAVVNPAWEYGVTIRARGAVGGEQIILSMEGASTPASQTVTLMTEWADYTATFSFAGLYTGIGARWVRLSVTGACTVDIASFVPHRAETGDVPLLMTAEEAAHLAAFAPSHIRMHQFCKSNPWTYTLDGITTKVGSGGKSGGCSLWSMLTNCAAAGVDPWLQIEWVWSDAEYLGLVEYLCAPYDPQTDTPETKPWAYRRHAQGRTAPWIDAFGTILFELGNENWNTIAEFYTLPAVSGETNGTVNGLITDRVANLMRTSPYWTAAAEAKFKWVLGGWWPTTQFGVDSVAASMEADYFTYVFYNGGWDTGDDVVPELSSAVAFAVGRDASGTAASAAALAAGAPEGRTKPLLFGTYEAGPGYTYPKGSDTKASRLAEDQVMKSVGVGTATLDVFLSKAAAGAMVQNFFTFGARSRWASHTDWQDGGKMNASALWLGVLNATLLPGKVVEIEPLMTARGALAGIAGAEFLGAYRVEGADASAVVLCNRSTESPITVTFAAEAPATGTLTRYAMTGGLEASNVTAATADDVEITATPVAYANRIETSVPAGETIIYVWEAA